MSTAGLINRYVWFVTTIYNRGPISLEEIQHRFESHFGRGEELSERQFHRYTDAVEELFDIEIKYSRSQRGYVVADREGIEHVYGFTEQSMKGLFFRGVGMVRATFYIGFTNLVYNMCRLVQIKRYHLD